ncbi:sugar phosphate isomerase/epimerase family protein [Celeribacter marinus]|uniref:Sugar phosphate isomerases/epimerase n=1 Tax=Celeribacter marinus TaxID=1397108 RepID=A0A0N9ZBZ8_9RHOB|nr:sugar phosphate isomerase/epimerase [Celeribacter marinus]ALI54191.1 sugar phosphate isomerases/epimerase [Celeribacter marinus]SFK31280.1 Sugar phosphate isomerase/epimerase [Celeribacter marinus]
MTDFSYQLYSSRNWGNDETLDMIGALGYAQCEGYGAFYNELDQLDALKARLAKNGLQMKSGHFALDMVENDPARVLQICKELNIEHVYVPYLMPDERPTDADGWRAFGVRLAKAGEPIKAAGLVFGWHNHDFEFVALPTGELPEDLILEGGDHINIELDIAWVVRGGADPIAAVKKYGKRITAVHVKDLAPAGEKEDEGGWADAGTGTMDWPAIWAAIQEFTAADVFVMEHDNPSDHARFAKTAITNAAAF